MNPRRGEVKVVTMQSGLRAMLDLEVGEVMHPVVGGLAESAHYVQSCHLAARLAEPGPTLTVFDVGLGAASNASAVWRCALEQNASLAASGDGCTSGQRALQLVSFERELAALKLAVHPEHARDFGLTGEVSVAVHKLLARGEHQHGNHTWTLIAGELPGSLHAAPALADIVLWDPFSPHGNPELWNVGAFGLMRRRCAPRATLHTFSGATAVRSALLLAGFYVGFGADSEKGQYTTAAVDARDLERPLGRRWLERLLRSATPLPSDAPDGALEQIKRHPQFRDA